MEPGGIQQLADLVEENQILPVTITEAGTLPLFTWTRLTVLKKPGKKLRINMKISLATTYTF